MLICTLAISSDMMHRGWYSRGYLPHFGSAETIPFVTFRLADSLPRAIAEALANSPDNLAKTGRHLDGGLGACWLRDPAVAAMVEESLLYFDGERYRPMAWCIMPNHVHAVECLSMSIASVRSFRRGSHFLQSRPIAC